MDDTATAVPAASMLLPADDPPLQCFDADNGVVSRWMDGGTMGSIVGSMGDAKPGTKCTFALDTFAGVYEPGWNDAVLFLLAAFRF